MKIKHLDVGILSLLTALVSLATPAHAYVYSSEAQYATWSNGSGFTIRNNVWGNSNPSQWMNVNNINSYNFYSNQTGGGVKSFASETCNPGEVSLSSMTQMDAYFSIAVPNDASGLWYAYMYIIQTQSDKDEIMLFERFYPGAPNGAFGTVIYSNVTFGGSTWAQIWRSPDSSSSHHAYFCLRSGQRTSGYDNLLDVMNWFKSKGLLNSSNIEGISFGVEITSTLGWQTFYVNAYTATWKTASGGQHI